MWKKAEFRPPPGDLEMVESHDHHHNVVDDGSCGSIDDGPFDFEDQGYTMDSAGKPTSWGRGRSQRKVLCIALLVTLTAIAAGLAYAVVPKFGLPKWTSSDNSNNGDDGDSGKQIVSEDSLIDNDAYDIILRIPVHAVEGDVVVYRHRKTLTPVMTILPDDTNQDSVFGISFRTKPSNSRGAPHVLEHAVLAGSKKYPIKDPFTQVLKGSLNTFVNAMTGDDLTSYVCASRNDVDMKNLMSVYMDAVFQPLVIEPEGSWIFRQEGWRVEMNETGEPEFNGVVLSEMKGAMSDPDEILAEYAESQLFPNSTARFNSGGDPKAIPDLTQAELISFFKQFYHPGNAQVFLYGTKASAENCLHQLDEYLSTYDASPDVRSSSKIDLQPLIDITPKRQQLPYEAEKDDDSHQLLMSWLISGAGIMDDEFQRENRLTYAALDELLMSDKVGAINLALRKSGLVGSIDGGIDMSGLQWTFDLQMASIDANKTLDVEKVVQDTLQKIVGDGFHDEDIESAVNTVEFNHRDISSDTWPRGIVLWKKIMHTWKFDLDPSRTGFLAFERELKELKQKVKKYGSKLFVSIIKENMINNQHSLVVDLFPDPSLAKKNADEEQVRLVKLRQAQTFPALLDETDNLSDKQVAEESPELLAKIPSVTVKDLAKQGYEPPILINEDCEGSGVTVLLHEIKSSFGIIYIDFGVDISMLDFEDIILLPLLSALMVDAGTVKYSDIQIAREIGINTGGIEDEILIDTILPRNATAQYRVPNGEHFHTKLFMRGAAMEGKADKLFELLSQIMFQPLLDSQERAYAILREQVSNLEERLASDGDVYTSQRLHARYTPMKVIEEKMSGVSSIPKFREILATAENDWSSLLARLEKMKQAIGKSNRSGMILNLTGEKSVLKHVTKVMSHFLTNQLPDRSDEYPLLNVATEPHPWLAEAKKLMLSESPVRNEGVVTTSQVNFVGTGGPFYEAGEDVPGSASVIAQYVEFNNFMLQIRERRGAYGAFVTMDRWTGLLIFMSYRDPNLMETLEVYNGVPFYLKDQMQNNATRIPLINSAIIGTIGSLDGSAPQPNTAGWLSMKQWLQGSTAKIRQTWREQILATSVNDFLEFAKRLATWKPTLSISGPRTGLEIERGLNLTMIDVL